MRWGFDYGVALSGQLSGVLNADGWPTVGIHLIISHHLPLPSIGAGWYLRFPNIDRFC